jgi:hypothetical protein
VTDDQTQQQPADDDEARDEETGPDAADLDADPAYAPDDEELKDLKGG